MRRRPSKRTRAILFSGLAFLAAYVAWWFPEITLFTCREIALACDATFTPAARAASPDRVTLDDAGRPCDPAQIAIVELRVDTDIRHFIGHAYLCTPARAVGFHPDSTDLGLADYLNPLGRLVSGRTRNDARRPFDRVRRFRAGPETLRLLEQSIDRHRTGPYQLGDWGGGRNCATWACDRLRDAGLAAPHGDRPNRLGTQMQPATWPSDV